MCVFFTFMAADQPIKYNSQIEKDEHDDSANIGGKRVILFAWNPSTLQYEKVTSTSGVINVSGGGGGGGAATVADGADVAEGATTDVAVVGDIAGTVSAKLRGLNKNIASALTDLDTIVTNTNKIISAPATSAKQDTGNTSLASIDTKTPPLGQALAAASMPVVLPAAQITSLTPPTNTGYALDSSLADVATIGAKTDAKSTATDTTSVSAMSVLKQISASVQAPPSQAVTNAGTFATQATLAAETTKVIGTVNIASAQTIATVTTVTAVTAITNALPTGTNNIGLVTPTPSSNTGWSFNYQSALSSTKAQIKGSAGTFGGFINLYNPNTAVTYIQVFNKTSANVTVGSTTPDFVITLPGVASASGTGSDRNLEITNGVAMSTGITIAATTTPTGSTGPSNAIVGTFLYI